MVPSLGLRREGWSRDLGEGVQQLESREDLGDGAWWSPPISFLAPRRSLEGGRGQTDGR